MIKIVLGLILQLFVLANVASEESLDKQDNRKVIHMGISFSIPPWVIQSQNSGIELDLLRAALDPSKYKVMPHFVPFALAYQRYDAKRLDGVINAQPGVAGHGYLTDPVVTLQNVAISLGKKGYPEGIAVSELYNKKVVAFQKASNLLGPEFRRMTLENEAYQEVANQNLQLNLLFIREVDFIVMDKSIFGYFWHESMSKNPNELSDEQLNKFKQPIRFHPMFAPSPYPFIFSDKSVRDDFNKRLRLLRINGQYDDIVKRYSHLTDLYVQP